MPQNTRVFRVPMTVVFCGLLVFGNGILAFPLRLLALQVFSMAAADVQMLGGVVPETYWKLASLGASGGAPQNAHRDLLTTLGTQKEVSVEVELPFTSNTRLGYLHVQQQLLLPHRMFAHLYTKHQEVFKTFVLGGQDNTEEFWAAIQGSDHYNHHWVKDENMKGLVVPLGLHGDGVPVVGRGKSWSKSLEIYSWSSLVAAAARIFQGCL